MPEVGNILDTFRAAGLHGRLVDAYDETTGYGIGEWDAAPEDASHDEPSELPSSGGQAP